jgi:uncharacterized protein
MATPLLVNVVELLRRPGSSKDVKVTVDVADLQFDDARMSPDPVDVDVKLESLTNGITVHGTASATWHGECRRCLAALEERMSVPLNELYQPVPDNPDAYPMVGDQIDLLPMVRENVLVAVPVGPLCREDCPGFCPQCGADLAAGACNCAPASGDARWAVLDALRERLPKSPE